MSNLDELATEVATDKLFDEFLSKEENIIDNTEADVVKRYFKHPSQKDFILKGVYYENEDDKDNSTLLAVVLNTKNVGTEDSPSYANGEYNLEFFRHGEYYPRKIEVDLPKFEVITRVESLQLTAKVKPEVDEALDKVMKQFKAQFDAIC